MADEFCLKMPDFHVTFRDLLHLRHRTNGFTSLPKEGVLRIFSPWKIRRLRPGLNPWTWVPKASTPPLNHRSRLSVVYPEAESLFEIPPTVPNEGEMESCRYTILSNGCIFINKMHYVISNFCGDFQQFRTFPSSLFDFPFVRLCVPDDVCVGLLKFLLQFH